MDLLLAVVAGAVMGAMLWRLTRRRSTDQPAAPDPPIEPPTARTPPPIWQPPSRPIQEQPESEPAPGPKPPLIKIDLKFPVFSCSLRQIWNGEICDYLVTGNDPAPGDRPVMRVYRINGDGRVGRKLAWALKRQLLQGHTNPRERYLMVEDGRIKRFRGVTPYLEEERREIQEELTALFADVSGGLKSWAQGQATPMCAVGLNGGGGHPVSSAESVENGYGPTCAERVWHSWDDQPPDVWGGVKKPAKPRRR